MSRFFRRRKAEIDTESTEAKPLRQIGSALDRFIGTWSAQDEVDLLEAVAVFERIEQDFWA